MISGVFFLVLVLGGLTEMYTSFDAVIDQLKNDFLSDEQVFELHSLTSNLIVSSWRNKE